MEFKDAYIYAIKAISRKAYLTLELRDKLLSKEISEEIVDKVIEKCLEEKFLNDEQYLESYVKGQISKKIGPKMIILKLQRKGISFERAKKLIQDLDSHESQKERLLRLLTTRYRTKDLSDFKTKEKVIASLIRKGFDYSIIKEIIVKQ